MNNILLLSFTLIVVTSVTLSEGGRKREDSIFRLVAARANCKKGTLYFDGCNWCECLGTDQDECDKGECIDESNEQEYVPDKRALYKRSRLVRSVEKREITSTVCRKNDPHEFFVDKYQCFCKDTTWFWCRVEKNGQPHDPFPTGHLEIDM